MQLFNTRTRTKEHIQPLKDDVLRIYSCGPTVYDHIHIGNLSAFIAADTLRRVIASSGEKVHHVMNFTDVDDKTIARSRQEYPEMSPEEALTSLTKNYEQIFLDDMNAVGNDVDAIQFVRATESISEMQQLIRQLYDKGFAYIADDGVYFSIESYRKAGYVYGQLTKISDENTSTERINNDEYDKESVHDFALWKLHKEGEPSWEFMLDDHVLDGRPGWHIECSAMSSRALGQPFDIHTGGIDLIFPHHENEIAQSTAGKEDPIYAQTFFHNEHVLVDGKKMSKSLQNFYTLKDIREHDIDPLAFRMTVLQSHYRNQVSFSWDSVRAAQSRLQSLREIAVLRYQLSDEARNAAIDFSSVKSDVQQQLEDDLNTPKALAVVSTDFVDIITGYDALHRQDLDAFVEFLEYLDDVFGLRLAQIPDIDNEVGELLKKRDQARQEKNWEESDSLRQLLAEKGVVVRDTASGQVWSWA